MILFFFSQTRTCAGLNAKETSFLVISIVNILTALGVTLYRFITVIKDGQSGSADFTFALILIINGGTFSTVYPEKQFLQSINF